MESEEIYLKDYFRLLVKNKFLIGRVFLIALIGSIVFSFYSPKIYTIATWLEIGKAKNVLVEEPNQIVRKIREGLYGGYDDMEVIAANQTNLIRVKIKSKDSGKAKEFLNLLNERILSEHNKLVNQEILFIEERIQRAEEEIKLWEEGKKKFDANSSDPVYRLSSFLAESTIEGKENEIKALKLSLSGIIDTKIAKEPSVLIDSQMRKFLLNGVVFGLIGLFLGISLAFWKEW